MANKTFFSDCRVEFFLEGFNPKPWTSGKWLVVKIVPFGSRLEILTVWKNQKCQKDSSRLTFASSGKAGLIPSIQFSIEGWQMVKEHTTKTFNCLRPRFSGSWRTRKLAENVILSQRCFACFTEILGFLPSIMIVFDIISCFSNFLRRDVEPLLYNWMWDSKNLYKVQTLVNLMFVPTQPPR